MSQYLGVAVMTKKPEQGRYELKAEQEWLDRAQECARSLGLKLAAYIRLVVTEDMNRRARENKANQPTRSS